MKTFFSLLTKTKKLLTLEDGNNKLYIRTHTHKHRHKRLIQGANCLENELTDFDCGYKKKLLITLSPLQLNYSWCEMIFQSSEGPVCVKWLKLTA